MIATLLFVAASCAAPQDVVDAVSVSRVTEEERPLVDQELTSRQAALLDLAFEAASKFPLDPHVKNRSRAQEQAVVASLQLGAPVRALRYTEGIANWRRGVGYADVAAFGVEHQGGHGKGQRTLGLLELAEAEALKAAQVPNAQAWRVDRIRARIARVHALLGDYELAREIEARVEPDEKGAVEAVRTERIASDEFEARLEAFSNATGVKVTFQEAQNSLDGMVRLFDRFYSDAERRQKLVDAVKAGSERMPAQIRFDVRRRLVEVALEKGTPGAARPLVDELQRCFDATRWRPEVHVACLGIIAKLRFRAGQSGLARGLVGAALDRYEVARTEVENFLRADGLVPVAEALATIGDKDAARALFGRALTEAEENPNARVRTDDFVLIACSMATSNIDPGEDLMARLKSVAEGLRAPW